MSRTRIPESTIQRQAAVILNQRGLLWTHVPNEGKRSVITGALLTQAGLSKGFPDIVIFDPPPLIPSAVGMAIELKAEGGRLTKYQEQWLDELHKRHWAACVAVGLHGLVKELQGAGYLRPGVSKVN